MTEQEGTPPADWDAVRAAYEGEGETLAALARRLHVSRKTLDNWAAARGWRRRYQPRLVDRAAIITRMFHLLERQIVQLDQNMTQTGEKEAAVLGKLAATLEKLIDIDNAAAEKPRRGQSKDMHDLRNKLAQRIEQLKRG